MRSETRLRWGCAALAAGTAILYLFRLGRAGLYDLDEAVYAEIAREMLRLHDWVTPHLDGLAYLEKPPLHDWLTAFSLWIFGLGAGAARLPTALAALAAIYLTWRTGRRLWGSSAGLAAGAVLATSFGQFIFGRMAMPDMLYSSLVTGALCAFGVALVRDSHVSLAPTRSAIYRLTPLAGWACMAGASLAKGLIGLVLPLFVVAIFLALNRQVGRLLRIRPFSGIPIFFVLAAPWHLLAESRHPGFLRFYIIGEHVMRFLGHRTLVNFASLPVWLFLIVTLGWISPWALFLPAALAQARRDWAAGGDERRTTQFVLAWAVGIIGFFCVSAARLEYYALPALPALALLIGRRMTSDGEQATRLSNAAWIAILVLAAALVPIAMQFPWLEHHTFYNLFPTAQPIGDAASGVTLQVDDAPGFGVLVPLLQKCSIGVLAGVITAAVLWYRRKHTAAWIVLTITVGAGLAGLKEGFVLFQPYRSSREIGELLEGERKPEEPIFVEGRFEHHAGVAFYSGSTVYLWHGLSGVLLNGDDRAGESPQFVDDAEFSRRWASGRRAYLVTPDAGRLAQLRRTAPATSAIARTGDTWLLSNRAAAGTSP